MRLTPTFGIKEGKELINKFLNDIDEIYPASSKSIVKYISSAKPYRIDVNEKFIKVLKNEAEQELDKNIKLYVCGPSNVGNLLYEYGIRAICGFGVEFDGLHKLNECILLKSINSIFNVYFNTIKSLCNNSNKKEV